MEKGFSVVLGMSLAYAVSFFGMLLAFIVWQRNHSPDELWRRRPVGVSFFSILYGFILPLLFLLNGLLTLGIKLVRGWEFNSFVWNTQALTWPLLVGVVLFWLFGRLFWRLSRAGYAAAVGIALAALVALALFTVNSLIDRTNFHLLGAVITGLIWHGAWLCYLLTGGIRRLFGPRAVAA